MVKPKKYYGQHFLTQPDIARKIVGSLTFHGDYNTLVEIGPGKGILTRYLLDLPHVRLLMVEIDKDCISYLKSEFRIAEGQILNKDFLQLDVKSLGENLGIIGNFPYNISSQILFKILGSRQQIMEVVGMFQKEVAERVAATHSNKTYGILSVLVQAFYEVEYLMKVKPGSFHPPPKVDSAIIRLKRNKRARLDCDEELFFRVVKQGFQNRRKTLRNALKPLNLPDSVTKQKVFDQRAEQLSVVEFEQLTKQIEDQWNK